MTEKIYYSHGKLLLSAEYAVLKGALALALPLQKGQKMVVTQAPTPGVTWIALHPGGEWFRTQLDAHLKPQASTHPELAAQLSIILSHALSLHHPPQKELSHLQITTTLEFNPEWGWGSSSSLIQNLASWLNIDAYALLAATFGGSGYDIACARANGPILYQLGAPSAPKVTPVSFSPPFMDHLWVIYLNKKQNSQQAISQYLKKEDPSASQLDEISNISQAMLQTHSEKAFGQLLHQHETLTGEITGLKTVRERLFPDFSGTLKSLGAWGGDFILAHSSWEENRLRDYFQTKGFQTLFKLSDITLNKDASANA